MRISLSIMAVPSRLKHVSAMLGRLGAQLESAKRAGLDVCGTSVFYDEHRKGPWHSWRGAWETHKTWQSTHHVVLQDDILFCRDLPETLHALASARPDDVVSGFLPRQSVTKAHEQGLRWVRCARYLWAQCTMLPVPLGVEAMQWIDAQEGTEVAKDWRQHDDSRLAAFFRMKKLPVFVAVPHPVEHLVEIEGGSAMGHNFDPTKRKAKVWIGEQASGTKFDWTDLRFVRE